MGLSRIWATKYGIFEVRIGSVTCTEQASSHNETGRRPTYTAWNGKKLPVTDPDQRRQETNSSATWILSSLLTTRPTLKGRDWCKAHNSKSAKLECLMVEASRKKSPGRVTRKQFNI